MSSSPPSNSLQPHSSESGLTMSSRHPQVTDPITSKRVCFYKSGDPQFKGFRTVINNRTYKTLDALLDSLSKRVPLPFGVRNITTPQGIHGISSIEELEDGKSYICSDQKKVKPINLEEASRKPLPWHTTRPVSARDNSVVIRTPRKLVVFKNGDAGIKHTIMLQRKTTQSFEALLDHVSEVMQIPVLKLYSADGRRIDGLQALILCSGIVVAVGREPFKQGRYDPQSQSLPTRLPGISNRVQPKQGNKPQQRNCGKWKVSVLTSQLPCAGTTSTVYIILYGERSNSGPIFLYSYEENVFNSGHEDVFEIHAGDIGELYKIRIGHSNSGEFPGWHCQEIRLQDLSTEEIFHFPVNRWLSRDESDGEICREVPVFHKGFPAYPVSVYKVHVVTGDLWNAGTEANVYVTVYGEKGDTGSRQLLNSQKPIKFRKGQTDIFSLEAVHLGYLEKVVIGHDGLGAGNGWFLEKVVVIDTLKDIEYTFSCNRWLDQGEDDSKIVRELYVTDGFSFSEQQEMEMKAKEIWAAERWKFQKGNVIQFHCRLTGRFVRLHPDGTVDALGDKKDKHGLFNVTVKRGSIRIFHSVQHHRLAIAIDQNKVTALVMFAKFKFVLPALYGAIILLNSSVRQSLCISPDGQCVGTGKQAEESYLRVHKVSGGIYMLESVRTPKMFIRMKDGQCDGMGTGDQYCHFKVDKNFLNGSLNFESVKSTGMYIGLLTDGRAKPLVYTGENNLSFYPQVIKFGREKPTGTSATMDKHFMAEEPPVRNQSIFRPSPVPASKTQSKVRVSSDSADDNWKVCIMTGNKGTKALVFLWVYGDQGVAGPINLKKNNKDKLFQAHQEDEFLVKIKDVGAIYKIRIGHDGTSSEAEWKLQKVTMRKDKGGPLLVFDVNRLLSKVHGNGETECELPVTRKKDGKPIYPVVQYQVHIYTGHLNQAETQSPVFICLFGERGDSGQRLLHKSDQPIRFQKGQMDTFQLDAVSLGKLQRVLLRCEAATKSQYWYCEKVVIKEPEEDSEYIFNCERWIPYSSQGIVKSDIELPLQEGDWKVTVVTGDFPSAATEATVFLFVYGNKGESGPIILGSGKHQLFNPNSADTFQVNLKNLGELYKIRIGHDNSGESPGWFLEEVILQEILTEKELILPVKEWLDEEKGSGDVWKELAIPRGMKNALAVVVYQVHIYTGAKPGAETDSSVYMNLIGTRGDTGKRRLHRSVNQKVKFQQGQHQRHFLAISKMLLGNGWFLEKVVIQFQEENRQHESVFLCNRWLNEYQDDGKTERELFAEDEYSIGNTELG
uniref:Oxygen-regulated protein 1 n=1 Tax=Erpetoichthys calabaricus TaxID=27687 RepID=A0A8C4RVI6_ERPCA